MKGAGLSESSIILFLSQKAKQKQKEQNKTAQAISFLPGVRDSAKRHLSKFRLQLTLDQRPGSCGLLFFITGDKTSKFNKGF